ncbi:hypothetical protein [Streptomyces sp. NPDC005435]|uniref:hypothetical protein n=1 Tax=Streptomyces sp. NPDC005435 TaxID=3154464 RepID=UPI00345121B2
MTAGHKDDAGTGDAGTDGVGPGAYGGLDALMAAITGEEPPAAVRRDARFRREHRAAEADVAVLRRELTRIAETLTGDGPGGTAPGPAAEGSGPADSGPANPGPTDSRPADPGPAGKAPGAAVLHTAPARPAPRPRRLRTALLALAASAALGLFGVGVSWMAAQGGGERGGASADSAASGAKLTPEGVIACARAVAEGTVERVERAGGGGQFTVFLKVDRFYKSPGGGRDELTFTVHDTGAPRYYRTGVRLLVLVPGSAAGDPQTYRAGDPPPERDGSRDALEWGRAWVGKALPGSRHLSCPGG